MKLKLITLSLLFGFSLLTCYKKSKSNNTFKLLGVSSGLIPSYLKLSLLAVDLSAVLKNTAETVVVPLVNQMHSDINDLKTKADTYKTSTTEANLTSLQTSWKTAKKSIRRLTSLYFGNHKLYFSRINPAIEDCYLNTTNINSEISGSSAINLANVKNFACSKRGMDTLEYLLFDNGSGVSTLADVNTANKNSSRRTDYIKALAEFYLENSQKYKTDWNGTFLSQFKNGSGYFMSKSDSMSKIAMEMHDTLRSIADYDIGNAGGFRKAPNNVKDINKLTSKYSNYSLDEMLANIEGIEALFFGTYKSKGDKNNSISYYLSKKNESANTRFKNALNSAKTKMQSLKTSKKTMKKVVDDNAAKELYDLVKNAKNIAYNEVLPALGASKLKFETDND